jgi:GAF domain-containing protein
MEDAGRRVSRYLSTQFLVNTCYGICVATGLHFIGVPNASLWGLLSGVLRFIPYVGAWVGALLPVLLSFAISTSWFTPLITIGLFVVLEAVVSNFVEPWVYGANTGVSPIALIISAVFWTWLWGPVGLVLSTPLTVCLAVMGRHVPRLEFLGILLSEDQALAPHEEFYHRLLSFSMDSAEEFATKYVEAESLTALYDNVLIPAIGAVEIDAHRGSITAEQRTSALQRVHEIIDDFSGSEASRNDAHEQKIDFAGAASATGSRVVCLPASAYCDELAGEMLAQLLRNQGFEAENVPARLKHEELIDRAVELQPECISVSVVPPTSIAQARHLASAIRERLKNVTILIGVWSARFDAEKLRERLRGAYVSDVAVSLEDAVQRIYKMTAAITDAMLPAPTPPNEEERLAELEGLNLLDTASEADFDQVTARLTRLFNVPMALVTLVDKNRQWFKSQAGLPADLAEARSTSRDISLCGHVIAQDEVLIVRDLARDPRFANNPFVKENGLRFYAGVPLRGPNGFPIGSLCILDMKPREMTRQEQELLKMIAGDVMEQIKRRPVSETPNSVASAKT